MALHPSVISILKKEQTGGSFWAPASRNRQAGSARSKMIQEALRTGKVTPGIKRLLRTVAGNLAEDVYLREAALKRAEGTGFAEAEAAYERRYAKMGPHKPYSQVLAEDKTFINRAKRTIAAIQKATK
jgi:hypothetical protein